MRFNFLLLLLLIACGSKPPVDETSTSSQEFNGNPPPPIVCESPKVLCGITCVDISRDNRNCGDCDQVCEVSEGEFCLGYYCRNVRDYGYYLGPIGPVEYDVRRDLPRPPRIREEDK